MSNTVNYNQRLPDLSPPNSLGVNGTPYPYISFTQYRDGSFERQDEAPGSSSRAHGHIIGTFKETDASGSHKELQVSYDHSYTQLGSTATVEGNHDHKIAGSNVKRVTGDHYHEHGGDHMVAVGGELIHAVAGSVFMHGTAGVQMSSTGDHTSDFNEGSHYHNVACNDIKYVQGVHYLFVGQEQGIFLPNGSQDTHVSNNINFTSGNNFTIHANSSTVITVGNTVITILPTSVLIHDGNGNEVGMNSNKMWVGNPQNSNIPVYLGGNGQNTSLYAAVATMAGASINVLAKYQQGSG